MRTFHDAKAMAVALRDVFWDALTVEVADPFGNRLLFNEYQKEK